MRAAGAAAAALACVLSGCLTIGDVARAKRPDPARVRTLAPGVATLADVTAALGAPLEIARATDGLALVYRATDYRFFRLGLDVSMVLRVLPVPSLPGVENLHFSYERTKAVEDRIVLQFDRRNVLLGIGYEPGIAALRGERTP